MLVLFPRAGSAQVTGFMASSFFPSTGPDKIFSVEQVGVSEAWVPYSHVLFHGERDSLRVAVGPRDEVLVAQHWFMDLNIGVGLWGMLQVDVSLPVALHMESAPDTAVIAPITGGGIGDLVLRLRGVPLDNKTGGFGVGLSAAFTVPTGDSERFRGDPSGAFYGALLLEYAFPSVVLTTNIGARVRFAPGRIVDVEFGNELTYAVGLDIVPWETIALGVEFFGQTPLTEPFGERGSSGLEVILGPRWFMWNGLALDLGVGAGLVRGRNTPDFRFMAGLRWAPSADQMSSL